VARLAKRLKIFEIIASSIATRDDMIDMRFPRVGNDPAALAALPRITHERENAR
jgi:hypothetical protein